MKKYIALFILMAAPLMVACSGGDSGLDDALNPYGFVVAAFDSTSTPSLASNDIRTLVRPSSTGPMYIGSDAGIQSFDPTKATISFTDIGGSPTNINELVADGDDFYVCCDTKLTKYDTTTNSFTDDTAIVSKKVLTFARQNDTTFWVGLEDNTAAQTVAKVENGVATFYGISQDMTASSVAHIYIDDDMVMACGTGDTGKGGLFKYDPSSDSFVKQVINTGLAEGATLFFTLGNTWYAGGPNSGLIKSSDNGNSWTTTALTACTPFDFAIETYNYLGYTRYWIATDKGTYLTYNMTNFANYDSSEQLAGDASRDVLADSTIWIANNGTGGGISRLAFDGN
jgi:hypothetical protein